MFKKFTFNIFTFFVISLLALNALSQSKMLKGKLPFDPIYGNWDFSLTCEYKIHNKIFTVCLEYCKIYKTQKEAEELCNQNKNCSGYTWQHIKSGYYLSPFPKNRYESIQRAQEGNLIGIYNIFYEKKPETCHEKTQLTITPAKKF